MPPLPLIITSLPYPDYELKVRDIYTPFHPQDGYLVDENDFNVDTRKSKLLDPKWNKNLNFNRNPNTLRVIQDLDDGSLSNDMRFYYSSNPDIHFLEKHLRFQIIVPAESHRLSFESRIMRYPEINPRLLFTEFYPIDTGQLPSPIDHAEQVSSGAFPGNRLFTPSSLDELQKIRGRFVISPK